MALVIGRGMDFPNVTLVVQVGLPMDADAYTHRVGRTARAGKDGRAIILLTEVESYFVQANRQFPIKTHPRSKEILEDKASVRLVSQAMGEIDEDSKLKAYAAYLGFMKPFINKLRLDPAGLVRLANEFAVDGMKCGEIPKLEKRLVRYVLEDSILDRGFSTLHTALANVVFSNGSKMGLKGVPGLRIAPPSNSGASVEQRVERMSSDVGNYDDGRYKRARHQGPPEMISELDEDDQGGPNRHGFVRRVVPSVGVYRGRSGLAEF